MEDKGKKFITLTEAAHLMGINRTTLHLWIKKDQNIKKNNLPPSEDFKCPPYGRMGNRYRFLREDVEKFIKDAMKD
jgi:predicted DNA-binding transcriptional regulator AlpA